MSDLAFDKRTLQYLSSSLSLVGMGEGRCLALLREFVEDLELAVFLEPFEEFDEVELELDSESVSLSLPDDELSCSVESFSLLIFESYHYSKYPQEPSASEEKNVQIGLVQGARQNKRRAGRNNKLWLWVKTRDGHNRLGLPRNAIEGASRSFSG